MSKGWSYKSGDWNIICDSCGKKFKASHSKHRWDGFIVCNSCYEERHPQDYIKAKTDKISVPFTRPQQTNVFVSGDFCTTTTRSGVSDLGTADCAIVDYIGDYYCEQFDTPVDYDARVGIAIVGDAIVGESETYVTLCASSQYEFDNKTAAISEIALAGWAVAGMPLSLNPVY